MNKLLGASLIIGASSLGGLLLSERLTERCRTIRNWIYVLEMLETEIFYQNYRLPEIFGRVGALLPNRTLGRAFEDLAMKVEFGSEQGVAAAWNGLLNDLGSAGRLERPERAVLEEFGLYLGATDREDQVRKIRGCRSRLESNLELAEIKAKQRTGLYRYFGFAAGAVVALWLL
jgi:stage III sporulation protein AB